VPASRLSSPLGLSARSRQQSNAPYDIERICHELVFWFVAGFGLADDVAVTLDVSPGDDFDVEDLPMVVNA